MIRVVLEMEKKPRDGDVLVYKNGRLIGTDCHVLLPDLKEARDDIREVQTQVQQLKHDVGEMAKALKEAIVND